MNLLDQQKSKPLVEFMNFMSFRNFVTDVTRKADYHLKKQNKIKTTQTLIDVVLHNQDLIISTNVVDHNISDHRMVTTYLKIDTASVKPANDGIKFKCVLNNKTLQNIDKYLNDNLSILNDDVIKAVSVNDKWLIFKNLLLNALHKNSRKVRSNQSKKRESSYPWFDPELVRLANKKDKMHAYWLKNTTNE